VEELKKAICDRVFEEKQSSRTFGECLVYNEVPSKLRFGDVLVVHNFSRFGRNKEEIKKEWENMKEDTEQVYTARCPPLFLIG